MKLKGNPLVSVVMPAYNAEKTIKTAIQSVLTQTHQNIELIVINDCSTDNTANVAKIYAANDSRVRLLENETNQGVSFTRMRGVEVAKGDLIAFLDSDDAWQPQKLEKQVLLQKETNAQLLFTGSAFMNADGEPLDWILHVPQTIGYKQLLKQNVISNSSVLIKKDAYLRCAVANDDMHEDFACWLRFLREGNVAYGIDEPLLIYRLSANSKSGNKFKAAKMNWNTYKAVGLSSLQAIYYMGWYTVKGITKYKKLYGGGGNGM